MKLLFCEDCWDVFKLDTEVRKCKCGKVSGRYLRDETNAEVNGKGISLAIGNGSLYDAIGKMKVVASPDRDFFLENTTVVCWVRPNEGPGNPHTRVSKNIDADHKCHQWPTDRLF